MRLLYPVIIALSLIAAKNSPADIRIADDNVAHQTNLTRQAVQQGDPAEIAAARAKLQAAQAVAWGKRHPPKSPVENVAVQ